MAGRRILHLRFPYGSVGSHFRPHTSIYGYGITQILLESQDFVCDNDKEQDFLLLLALLYFITKREQKAVSSACVGLNEWISGSYKAIAAIGGVGGLRCGDACSGRCRRPENKEE